LVVLGSGVVVLALVNNPHLASQLPDPFDNRPISFDAGATDAYVPPLLTTPVMGSSRVPAVSVEVPAAHPRHGRGRGVIHIGSTAEEVLRVLGQPDGFEPGRRPDESVLHFGALRLEMRNGRVVGGDAAAR
jgi:hypothetical protein